MTACWMVRAGVRGRFATDFRENSYVAIGWGKLGSLADARSREELVTRLEQAYPEARDQTRSVWAAQLFRFVRTLNIDDRIVTYDPAARSYLCGIITGPYEYHPEAESDHAVNRRAVSWLRETSKDGLSIAAQSSLGALSTIFRVSEPVAAELWRETVPQFPDSRPPPEQDTPSLSSLGFEQLSAASLEAISDRIARFGPYEMQELVAGLLRAMGYKTIVSKPGSDRGRDIIASPDGFGFKEPRIVVEVKHRPGQRMGAVELRSFLGGRHRSDKGLYVSTGGFTNEARYEAERATIPLTLIDFEDLIEAIVDNYGRFDDESRRLLPLRLVYWPTDE